MAPSTRQSSLAESVLPCLAAEQGLCPNVTVAGGHGETVSGD